MHVSTRYSNSSIVVVSWEPVPNHLRHGVIVGYKVFYQGATQETENVVTVNNSVRTARLHNLNDSTMYCIRVLAFTKVGDGNFSACAMVSTSKGKHFKIASLERSCK